MTTPKKIKTQIPFINNKSELSKISGTAVIESRVTPTFTNGLNVEDIYDETYHKNDKDDREIKRSLIFNVHAYPHSMGITHDSTKAFHIKEIKSKTDSKNKKSLDRIIQTEPYEMKLKIHLHFLMLTIVK